MSNIYLKLLLLITLLCSNFTPLVKADLLHRVVQEFNSKIYYDSPSFIALSGQGVYSGGNLYLRNRIVDLELFSFTPPVFNAGCGGIDFYGGSFSFINQEAFVQLAKSVASNAVGYSFSLAMNHLCPSCGQVIESLQQKVQELNQYMGNSCQLAQGLVNNSIQSFNQQKQQTIALQATNNGVGDLFHTSNNKVQQNYLTQDRPENDKFKGNLLYQSLLKANPEIGEVWINQLISITGTLIIKDDPAQLPSYYQGGLLGLEQLLGDQISQLYSCANQQCTNMTISNKSYPTLTKQILNAYLGDNYSNDLTIAGILGIYLNNQGKVSAKQQKIMQLVGHGINSQLRNLILHNPQAAVDYLSYAVKFVALEVSALQIKQSFFIIKQSIAANLELALQQQLLNKVEFYEQIFNQDYQRLSQLYQAQGLLNYYQQLLKLSQ